MNLTEIIHSTRNYNFHTHTQFCDGRSAMAEIAGRAVAEGFAHLGFTPHSPIAIESPCNMSRGDVAAFRAEAARLDADLPLKVYAGMEIDYLNPAHGPATPYFTDLNLDFSIGSVHFIPSQSGEYIDIDGNYERFARNMSRYFENDLRYVVETFFAQSAQMLERGGFDILGHFDKVAKNAAEYDPDIEQRGWYADLVDSYIDQIIGSGVIVEINTKAFGQDNRFFPHLRYWQRLVDAGAELAVNSDCHYSDLLTAGRDEAFRILSSIGYAY